MFRKFASSFPFIVLAACMQPQTMTPGVTQAELQQEQILQQRYANDESLRKQEVRNDTALQMQQRLQAVFKPIARAGANVCMQMTNGRGQCVFNAMIAQGQGEDPNDVRGVNAFADGEKIVVNPAMMRFARDDNELAFVLAHELAHNILRHPQSTQTNAMAGGIVGLLVDSLAASQGVNTQGAFSNIGMNTAVLRYSSAFEAEADYVGLYIMANAGLDYANAANFWRRMSVRDTDAIYTSTTHPSNPERFVAMQKTTNEINDKKARRLPLLPEIRRQ